MIEQSGTQEGDICNRDGCNGVIEYSKPINCSCHLNAPCAPCMDVYLYCPVCEWDEREEDNYEKP